MVRPIFVALVATFALAGCNAHTHEQFVEAVQQNDEKYKLTTKLRELIAQRVYSTDAKRMIRLRGHAEPMESASISSIQTDSSNLLPFYCVDVVRKDNLLKAMLGSNLNRTYKVLLKQTGPDAYLTEVTWNERRFGSAGSGICNVVAPSAFPELVEKGGAGPQS
jgi:hypothetical protein